MKDWLMLLSVMMGGWYYRVIEDERLFVKSYRGDGELFKKGF